MSLKVYIDGKLYDKEDAKISVFDHGFLYGDGVFEGIRSYGGNVFRLDAHLDRLWDSAKAIHLTFPDKPQMAAAIRETLAVNGIADGYIRVVVTRGCGTLGLDPNRCTVRRSSSSPTRSASIPRSSIARGWRSSPRARCGTIRPRSAPGSSRSTT